MICRRIRRVARAVSLRRVIAPAIIALIVLLAAGGERSSARELLLRVGDLDVPFGTVVRGDAIAVAGTARIDGTVEGDAVVLGGTIDVGGHVTGSVRAEGGNVTLRPTASVDGDVSAVGGVVRREPGATVRGLAQPSIPPSLPPLPPLPFPPGPAPPAWPFPAAPWWLPGPLGTIALMFHAFFRLAELLARLAFVVAAWLLIMLFPATIARLAALLERDPIAVFAVGLLGWPIALGIGVVLIISIVGLTLVFLLPVALLVAVQLGTTALALLIGQRIRPMPPPHAVFAGAIILAVAFSIPIAGNLIALAAATWGLGAVLLLLWERRRLRGSPPGAQPPAASDPSGRPAMR